MEAPETQNLVPSVKLLSKPGVSVGSPSPLVSPCFCTPGDYCVQECIHLDSGMDVDDFRINIASGEDVCV